MKINLNSREGFYAIYGLMKKGYTLGEAINQIGRKCWEVIIH